MEIVETAKKFKKSTRGGSYNSSQENHSVLRLFKNQQMRERKCSRNVMKESIRCEFFFYPCGVVFWVICLSFGLSLGRCVFKHRLQSRLKYLCYLLQESKVTNILVIYLSTYDGTEIIDETWMPWTKIKYLQNLKDIKN